MFKNIIFPLMMILILSACKTTDQHVEQLVHTRQSANQTEESNTFKKEFISNIQGKYALLDGTEFTIDARGSFKIGDTEYFVHQALNSSQGIYVAVQPDSNSSKKIYTYHGIINTGSALLSAPYKAPVYTEGQRALTEKDTPHAWKVNTFQPQNINWKSGFSTTFANKI